MAVFVNGRGMVHRGSGGQSVASPDVCRTQRGSSVVPIPYTNVGRSSDTTDGPLSVTVDGHMPMVKGARYRRSTGDEPGSRGGISSGTTAGACEFITYSFDVKIEGRNVCRLGDQLLHNGRNAAGGIEVGEPSQPAKPVKKSKLEKSYEAWTTVVVKDTDGVPIANIHWRAELPDGTVVTGISDAEGKATIPSSKKGQVKVTFPELESEM